MDYIIRMNEPKVYKFGNPVFLTKEEMLALSDLAGDKSMSEYMAQVIREHIKQHKEQTTSARPGRAPTS